MRFPRTAQDGALRRLTNGAALANGEAGGGNAHLRRGTSKRSCRPRYGLLPDGVELLMPDPQRVLSLAPELIEVIRLLEVLFRVVQDRLCDLVSNPQARQVRPARPAPVVGAR